MGHVVLNAMQMIGMSKTPRLDSKLRQSLCELSELAAKSNQLTNRELLHVKAVQLFADGYHSRYVTLQTFIFPYLQISITTM